MIQKWTNKKYQIPAYEQIKDVKGKLNKFSRICATICSKLKRKAKKTQINSYTKPPAL